jgi:cytochrome c5
VKKISSLQSITVLILTAIIITLSCSKGGDKPPQDPCAGVTVVVTATPASPTTFGGTDGSISASASGGSASFTYSLNGGAFQSSGNFTGLIAGNYTVTAKNSNGCTGSATVTIAAPPNPCAGVTIVVNGTVTNPATTGVNTGSIAATASGGSTAFTYSLNNGTFQTSGTFTGLAPGNYTITAKNTAGCLGSASFTVVDPCTGITINVTGTVVNPTTVGGSNGSITANATGASPVTYQLNNGAFQASGTFTGLAAGSYSVTARSAAGCLGTANFTLTNPNPCAGVSISVTNVIINNTPCLSSPSGSITATASGGNGSYVYSLNGGPFQTSNIFANLNTGSYTITARDGNNCSGNSTPAAVNNVAAGPLFAQVKTVLQNNCLSCHNATVSNGGMNWAVDCNIVTNKDRIKARAVDAVPSAMPPVGLMPASERQKITDWINAGGRYTD